MCPLSPVTFCLSTLSVSSLPPPSVCQSRMCPLFVVLQSVCLGCQFCPSPFPVNLGCVLSPSSYFLSAKGVKYFVFKYRIPLVIPGQVYSFIFQDVNKICNLGKTWLREIFKGQYDIGPWHPVLGTVLSLPDTMTPLSLPLSMHCSNTAWHCDSTLPLFLSLNAVFFCVQRTPGDVPEPQG